MGGRLTPMHSPPAGSVTRMGWKWFSSCVIEDAKSFCPFSPPLLFSLLTQTIGPLSTFWLNVFYVIFFFMQGVLFYLTHSSGLCFPVQAKNRTFTSIWGFDVSCVFSRCCSGKSVVVVLPLDLGCCAWVITFWGCC